MNAPQRRSPAASEKAREEDRALLRRYHEDGDTTAREELIERHLPLVRSLARRYAGRGEALEDIEQVGAIGLIKAIDRFELEREVSLATYATPNVVGEIKRHFRDKGWAIRVPRALQELNASMSGAIERLTGRLGRSPSIAEIAEELKTTPEEVLEAMEVGSAYSTVSLSTGPGGDEELDPLETIGGEDEEFERSEDRAALEPALDRLPQREREILRMRFEEGLPADADRPAGRALADARVAPDPQVALDHARGAAPHAARAPPERALRAHFGAAEAVRKAESSGYLAARRAVSPAETTAGGIEWESSVDVRWCCSSPALSMFVIAACGGDDDSGGSSGSSRGDEGGRIDHDLADFAAGLSGPGADLHGERHGAALDRLFATDRLQARRGAGGSRS